MTAVAEPIGGGEAPRTRRRKRWAFGRLLTVPLWFSIIVLVAFVGAAVFAGLLSPYGPDEMTLASRLRPPGWAPDGKLYLLGTDVLGRDLFTRMLYGARVSLLVAGTGLVFGGGLGLAVGVISGYLGGLVDAVLMRVTDVFMALPALLIALVFSVTIGPGTLTVVAALSFVVWSRFSRVIRSEVLSLRERSFVLQSKVAGSSEARIMLVHILPNVMNTFIVLASLQVSHLILTEATLSFLGAGVMAPTPTWGNMVSDGRNYIETAWWICVFPGVALSIVVIAFNSLGDWLRDRLDPRLRQL